MSAYIERLRSQPMFVVFYWMVKIALGIGFVGSGIRKLPGIKFTQIATDNPIGLFFEGMYQTGFYWNFIGYYQMLVGLMLMTNWFKSLSPVLAFPVTFNIFLVSASLHMKGTPVITTLMLLGNIFLMIWHSKSYQSMLKR